jgi:hypothetical protein
MDGATGNVSAFARADHREQRQRKRVCHHQHRHRQLVVAHQKKHDHGGQRRVEDETLVRHPEHWQIAEEHVANRAATKRRHQRQHQHAEQVHRLAARRQHAGDGGDADGKMFKQILHAKVNSLAGCTAFRKRNRMHTTPRNGFS